MRVVRFNSNIFQYKGLWIAILLMISILVWIVINKNEETTIQLITRDDSSSIIEQKCPKCQKISCDREKRDIENVENDQNDDIGIATFIPNQSSRTLFLKSIQDINIPINLKYDLEKNRPKLDDLNKNLNFNSVAHKSSELTHTQEQVLTKMSWANTPNNKKLFIHTKMPRCGSTTMKALLGELSRANKFEFYHFPPEGSHGANSDLMAEKFKQFYEARQERKELIGDKTPMLFIRHMSWLNFTKIGGEQPTVLNVVRDPISRWVSSYNLCHFGVAGRQDRAKNRGDASGDAGCANLKENEIGVPVEIYLKNIREKNTDKMANDEQNGLSAQFLTWIRPDTLAARFLTAAPDSQKSKFYAEAKTIVLKHYYTIGILERFSDTLKLFEKMLPSIFSNAEFINNHSTRVAVAKRNSKSVNATGISDETRKWLSETHFKYDVDLFEFIKMKFHYQFETFVLKRRDFAVPEYE